MYVIFRCHIALDLYLFHDICNLAEQTCDIVEIVMSKWSVDFTYSLRIPSARTIAYALFDLNLMRDFNLAITVDEDTRKSDDEANVMTFFYIKHNCYCSAHICSELIWFKNEVYSLTWIMKNQWWCIHPTVQKCTTVLKHCIWFCCVLSCYGCMTNFRWMDVIHSLHCYGQLIKFNSNKIKLTWVFSLC